MRLAALSWRRPRFRSSSLVAEPWCSNRNFEPKFTREWIGHTATIVMSAPELEADLRQGVVECLQRVTSGWAHEARSWRSCPTELKLSCLAQDALGPIGQRGSMRAAERPSNALYDAPSASALPALSPVGSRGKLTPGTLLAGCPRHLGAPVAHGSSEAPKGFAAIVHVDQRSSLRMPLPAWLAKNSDCLPELPGASRPLRGQPTSRQRHFSVKRNFLSLLLAILFSLTCRLCAITRH